MIRPLRRVVAAMLAPAMVIGGAALATHPAAAASVRTVHIRNIDFSPHTLMVSRGTTVRWRFEDGDTRTPHNVTSRGHKRFRSSPTKQSGTYSVRFAKAGTYGYVCTIHPNMKARIVVR